MTTPTTKKPAAAPATKVSETTPLVLDEAVDTLPMVSETTPLVLDEAVDTLPMVNDVVDTTTVIDEAVDTPARYVAVFGDLVDPVSGVRFTTGVPTPSHRTGWMDFQIEHGKLKEFSA